MEHLGTPDTGSNIYDICKDPSFLMNLNDKKRRRDIDVDIDIWQIGLLCYEMLTGKMVFDSETKEEIAKKIENGIYYIPLTLSYETISFINGMIQYDFKKRLTASELSKHDFLNKNVSQFKKIDFDIPGKINSGMLEIDAINNSIIWSFFNKKDENEPLTKEESKDI